MGLLKGEMCIRDFEMGALVIVIEIFSASICLLNEVVQSYLDNEENLELLVLVTWYYLCSLSTYKGSSLTAAYKRFC